MPTATEADLNLIFAEAHTYNKWQDRPVDDQLLRRVYELARMAPTAANSQPMRVLFVKTAAGKEGLRPALAPGNVDKTMNAPVTAVIAYDRSFADKMPRLFPAVPGMKDTLGGLPAEKRDAFLLQNASLQAAYLIVAARALGLDCGPMGGFDGEKVDAAFFTDGPEGRWKSILLVNLGYGDGAGVYPRNPRLDFAEATRVV
jgi:3-hydroxypropanoate dehydrogenase